MGPAPAQPQPYTSTPQCPSHPAGHPEVPIAPLAPLWPANSWVWSCPPRGDGAGGCGMLRGCSSTVAAPGPGSSPKSRAESRRLARERAGSEGREKTPGNCPQTRGVFEIHTSKLVSEGPGLPLRRTGGELGSRKGSGERRPPALPWLRCQHQAPAGLRSPFPAAAASSAPACPWHSQPRDADLRPQTRPGCAR